MDDQSVSDAGNIDISSPNKQKINENKSFLTGGEYLDMV
jgi:hypothetical protein